MDCSQWDLREPRDIQGLVIGEHVGLLPELFYDKGLTGARPTFLQRGLASVAWDGQFNF